MRQRNKFALYRRFDGQKANADVSYEHLKIARERTKPRSGWFDKFFHQHFAEAARGIPNRNPFARTMGKRFSWHNEQHRRGIRCERSFERSAGRR